LDRLLNRPKVVTAGVTLVAALVSAAITEATMWYVGYDAGAIPLLLASLIPGVMVPVTVYPLASANQRLRQMRSELERLAHTDVLTGLPNRRAFFDQAERMLDPAAGSPESIAALMIDVDHFKAINDTQGHAAGDQILRAVAHAVQGAVAETAPAEWTVARIGGEEFAVLANGMVMTGAARMAERICQAVRQRGPGLDHSAPPPTVSVGVALRTGDADIDALLRAADSAVYLAKRSGRDRWALAPDPSLIREPALG
jgi:diguanylate cyclase (GGDEF)-like protein